MYLIGFFKVAGHLGEDLTVTDSYIHGKPECVPDPVLNRWAMATGSG